MSEALITNIRALEPGKGIVGDWVHVLDGKIAALGPADRIPSTTIEKIDGAGRLLTPGMIDLHTHGVEHFAYEAGPEQLIEASRRLARYGTTCVLPTLYRSMSKDRLRDLEKLSAALATVENASMPGFHLEGPFLSVTGAGAQTLPGDVGLLDELISAAGGKVRAMSISPETPGIIPVIERMCERGIVPFITHTQATVDQAQAAIDAGARHATHFYDVFPQPKETDPGVRPTGVVEAYLADPRATVDFIADGVHVHPTAIRAAVAAKSWRGVLLITDSNVGAGLPPGIYDSPVGGRVRIAPGDAARAFQPGSRMNGTLAGSALTMDRGMTNLLRWLDLPEEQVWTMSTANPARLLGLPNKGTLRVGADADLVLWDSSDDRLEAAQTWFNGRCVYRAE